MPLEGQCDHGHDMPETVSQLSGGVWERVLRFAPVGCCLCNPEKDPHKLAEDFKRPTHPSPLKFEETAPPIGIQKAQWVPLGSTAGPVMIQEEGKEPVCLNNPDADVTHQTTKALDKAKGLVCGDRAKDYGDPAQLYGPLADAWAAYDRACGSRMQTGRDVTNKLGIMKFFRDAITQKEDNMVDAAGYAQLGNWQGKKEFRSMNLSYTIELGDETDEVTKAQEEGAVVTDLGAMP